MVELGGYLPFGLSFFKKRNLMNSMADSFGKELNNKVLPESENTFKNFL